MATNTNSTARKRITILDIASEAKVSISTVSRVLNGTVPVREDKRVAVEQAVKRLEYRPNAFAQSLASGQSMTIGVLTQNISSPTYDAILHGTLSGLRGTGYSPIIADGHWQAEKEQKAVFTLQSRQVDGLIMLGPTSDADYLKQIAQEVPLVIIGREEEALTCISVDEFAGGYAATKHLIDQGHRQIAHIAGIRSHRDAQARLAGYKQALLDAGLEVDEGLIVEGQFSEQSGLLAVEMLLTRGRSFSALFAANDQMAYGANLAFFRHSIRVPDDISIVGYDGQAFSAYLIPPLTTMTVPVDVVGAYASASILKMIQGEPIESLHCSAELVVRESTARFR